MARQLRGNVSEGGQYSSDSQGDMADTELDPERSQLSGTSQSSPEVPVPPKKKRTRTLTTPHQSAVLHALLAQSRFPTTAMREEVGRSIGLSARKVQIWFQNQRQKARRPKKQQQQEQQQTQSGSGPREQLPGFEPFSHLHEPYSHHYQQELYPAAGQPGASGFDPLSELPRYTSYPPEAPAGHSSQPLESPVQRLSGPGMPGRLPLIDAQGFPLRSPMRGPEWSPVSPTTSTWSAGSRRSRRPIPYPDTGVHRTPSPEISRLFSRARQPSPPSDYAARTLPPLPSLSMPPSRPTTQTGSPPGPVLAPLSPYAPSPSESVFAYHAPGVGGHAIELPPPFALQPQPQWDDRAFLSPTRASFLMPSRSRPPTSGTYSSRPPTMGSSAPTPRPQTMGLSAPTPRARTPPSHSGRYDPVRGLFVPYRSPTPDDGLP
ncbi:hypothetical protein BD626DRAFT_534902 [Schizophyllum amplum]|uniref:Homeobox domain-containing protein n=1 Tax=Schizophyllum amplum TaxID=97359 RepID=A0A550CPR0_9AGAR|nr:hypothetical protein BD626DRAFT_534902 [Auriculariopsis ampla]